MKPRILYLYHNYNLYQCIHSLVLSHRETSTLDFESTVFGSVSDYDVLPAPMSREPNTTPRFWKNDDFCSSWRLADCAFL
jgi:hypothetical protein